MNKKLTIHEIKHIVSTLAINYDITKAYLFGSYARDEATADSDVDIMIEKGRKMTLFKLGGFLVEMEDAFQKKVDLITINSIQNEYFLKKNLEKDRILLYEK